MNVEKTKVIVEKHKSRHDNGNPPVIPILQDVQQEYGWLPPEALLSVSEMLAVPVVELHGIATFYASFRLKPPGEYKVGVCTGTACHVKGSAQVLSNVERKLGVSAGDVTVDGKFSLETVSCVGCCALAPVMTVNEDYHSIKQSKDVDRIIDSLAESKKGNQE